MLDYEGAGLLCDLLVAAETGKPVDCGVFAEPGELAFSVVAMALLGSGDGLVACHLPAQQGDCLGVAERGERAAFLAIAGDDLGGLFDEAASLVWRVEHMGGAAVDACVEFGARGVEAEAEDTESSERIVRPLPLACDRLTRGECDFDGADDLGCVVGVDEAGRCGIKPGEDSVKAL